MAERTAAVLLCSTGASDLSDRLRVLPPMIRPPALRRALHRRVLQSRLPMGPVTALSRALLKQGTMGPGATAAQVAACAEIVHACPAGVRSGAARMLGDLDVRPGLTMLEAPTAIVVGSHDRLTPPPHAHAMHAALRRPDGLLELPGVGHMAPVERPDEVTAELRRLVRTYLTGAGPASASPTSARPASVRPASAHSTSERTEVA